MGAETAPVSCVGFLSNVDGASGKAGWLSGQRVSWAEGRGSLFVFRGSRFAVRSSLFVRYSLRCLLSAVRTNSE
jgi:hypothetical protein